MAFKAIIYGALFAGCSLNTAWAETSKRNYDEDAVILERPKGAAGLSDRTTQSGYCCTVFDVTKQGRVQNVRVNYCTHDQLAAPIKNWVQRFRFEPARLGGQPVYRRNKRYNQSYFRFGGVGSAPIPGPDGFLKRKEPSVEIPPRPKSIAEKRDWVEKHFDTKMSCAKPIV